jgi:hypothetical protein
MIPDADVIIACPHCAAPARVFQIMSGNTLDAITWTDGWMDAPMLPRAPRLTRCHACAQIYWVFLAPQLGFQPLDHAGEHQNAPHIAPPSEADCFEALATGLGANEELELELRVLAWWRGNDAFREPAHAPGFPTSPEAIANMERFIAMTENGDEDLLLFRAEALRQLGRWAEARETLRGVGCSDYWPAKSRQLELLDAEERNLAILFSPERPPPDYS